MMSLLAALRSTGSEASTPGATPGIEIRDIVPPVDFFPWPLWQVLLAGFLLLALLGLGVALFLRHLARRPPPPAPTPRQVALGELARLRPQVQTLGAYEFSIAVSSVLRAYIEAQYKLRALEQTSPEFLATIASAPEFTGHDRTLLAEFLEQCDLIKFARVEAGAEASEALLGRALAFVQGGRG